MFNLDKAHFILSAWRAGGSRRRGVAHGGAGFADEMVMNGRVVETNKVNVLKPVLLMQKASK